MARLHASVKRAIVRGLAAFDSPGQVAKSVKAEFGVDVSPQQVEAYDPTKRAGADLSAELRTLFVEERERAKMDIDAVAIAHKPVRLRKLQRAIERAEARGNDAMLLQLLDQAAKEVEGTYAGRRQVTVDAKVAGEVKHEHRFTAEDNANLLREVLGALAEDAGGPGASE